MLKSKDETSFCCGMDNGAVEIRLISDLSLITTFNPHSGAVISFCELEDGWFVSGSRDTTLKVWDLSGRVTQTFSGHEGSIHKVIELNRDTIASGSEDNTIKIWGVSSGECLRTLTFHSRPIVGIVKLMGGLYVSVGRNEGVIVVWDEQGNCVEAINTLSPTESMVSLKCGLLILAKANQFEIRRV